MLSLLVSLLIMLLIFGIVYWVSSMIPLPPPFRIAVNAILGLIAIIMLLGFVGWIPGWNMGHLRY